MLSNGNVKAAMATIRHTEGTTAEDGYNYLFGSAPGNELRFKGYATHPNVMRRSNGIASTAAGAYQILKPIYDHLCKKYGFADFAPETQDMMCLALMDEHNVLGDVARGKLLTDEVLTKLSHIWASLPYAKYGQPTHTVADVRAVYTANGGLIGTSAA